MKYGQAVVSNKQNTFLLCNRSSAPLLLASSALGRTDAVLIARREESGYA